MLEKLLEPMLSQARELRGCPCSQHTAGDTRGPRKRWECHGSGAALACAELESLVALPVQLPGPHTHLPACGAGLGSGKGGHGTGHVALDLLPRPTSGPC